MKTIIIPTIQGMAAEGRVYTGVLYAGLMLTPNGPKVLEYNCRFGDPETQVQMLRLEDDLADLCLKIARGNLGDTKLNWKKEAAACVVIAVDGYPDDFPKGQEVEIDPIDDDQVTIFHGGTIKRGGNLMDLAAHIHRELPEKLKSARIWGTGVFDGQTAPRDHVLHDKDVVEIHV